MVNNPQPKRTALALLQISGEWTYSQMFLIKIKCSRQKCIIYYKSALCLTLGNTQHPTVPNGGRQGDITYCICNSLSVPCAVTAPWLWERCFLCQELSSGLLYLAHSCLRCTATASVISFTLPLLVCLFVSFLSQQPQLIPIFGDCPTLRNIASYCRRRKRQLFSSLLLIARAQASELGVVTPNRRLQWWEAAGRCCQLCSGVGGGGGWLQFLGVPMLERRDGLVSSMFGSLILSNNLGGL